METAISVRVFGQRLPLLAAVCHESYLKGVLQMRSLIPWKQKRGGTSGELAPFGDFPFSLSRMRDEFDRLFDRLAREFSTLAESHGQGWRWGLEVEDENNKVIVRAEAPGFEAGDFDLRVEDGRLILHAAKKVEVKDEKGKVKEYREQECDESIALPVEIDKDKVDAQYHNGVLTVTLPKTATAKAKKIAVKAS
jgi:HSP20 family protein